MNDPFDPGAVTVLMYFATPDGEKTFASPPTVAAVARHIQLNDCGTAATTE